MKIVSTGNIGKSNGNEKQALSHPFFNYLKAWRQTEKTRQLKDSLARTMISVILNIYII